MERRWLGDVDRLPRERGDQLVLDLDGGDSLETVGTSRTSLPA